MTTQDYLSQLIKMVAAKDRPKIISQDEYARQWSDFKSAFDALVGLLRAGQPAPDAKGFIFGYRPEADILPGQSEDSATQRVLRPIVYLCNNLSGAPCYRLSHTNGASRLPGPWVLNVFSSDGFVVESWKFENSYFCVSCGGCAPILPDNPLYCVNCVDKQAETK